MSAFLARKIRALVVDDSVLIRQVLSDILTSDPSIEVVGTAHDGRMALEKVKLLKPDVITLDVEMPIMDGIECLRNLMKQSPTPVVMVSSITYEGGFKTLQALDAGAFDYIQKPRAQASSSLNSVSREIISKVKEAVQSSYIKKYEKNSEPSTNSLIKDKIGKLPPKLEAITDFKDWVIAIGISTGGPPCVSKILETMPKNSPPILVVQHMPKEFTRAMAERIDKTSLMQVKEAADGDPISCGLAYIAPGHSHITITREKGIPQIKLSQKGPVSGHQPSADVLFESVAQNYGKKSVGVIMTGMGRDGVTELKGLRAKGAHTIAQNEETCTVFGMPKIAIQEEAVDEILSLDGIVLRLKKICETVKVS